MEFFISSTDSGPLGRRAGTGGWVQGPAENCISIGIEIEIGQIFSWGYIVKVRSPPHIN